MAVGQSGQIDSPPFAVRMGAGMNLSMRILYNLRFIGLGIDIFYPFAKIEVFFPAFLQEMFLLFL